MKKILIALSVLIVTTGIPLKGKSETYLRVVADSNTTAALERKMEIKDLILSTFAQNKAKSFQTINILCNELSEIEEVHFSYSLWSPGGIHKPCPTLICTIGSGKGHNWWGILYDDIQTWDLFLWGLRNMEGKESNPYPLEKKRTLEWPLLHWLLSLI